jgi:hypothetical protein
MRGYMTGMVTGLLRLVINEARPRTIGPCPGPRKQRLITEASEGVTRLGVDPRWRKQQLRPLASLVLGSALIHAIRRPDDPWGRRAPTYNVLGSSGTSTASSWSTANGTSCRTASWVDARTTGAATPSL